MNILTDVATDKQSFRGPFSVSVAGATLLVTASALTGALFQTGVSGIFFWLLVLFAMGAGVMGAVTGRAGVADHSPSRAWLWFVALLPIGLGVVSVLAFDLRASAASWWPLLGIPLIACLPLRFDQGPRILTLAAIVANLVALPLSILMVVSPQRLSGVVTVNSILFGQVTIALSLICGLWLARERVGSLRAGAFLGMIAGLIATALSGYRGGLLCLPLFVTCFLGAGLPLRRVLAWMAPVFVILVAAIAFSPMLDRIELAAGEIHAFAEGTIAHSSVGTRLALWEIAAHLFMEHPLMGVGAGQFGAEMKALALAGNLPQDLDVFDHAHNTYFNVAAEYGVIGLGVFAAAVLGFWHYTGRVDPLVRRVARYSLLCWLLSALTNDVMAHQSSIRIMSLMLGLTLAGATTQILATNPGRKLK